MENPALYKALVQSLKEKNFSSAEIERFNTKWLSITNADAQPCPLCYLADGTISRLIALNEEHGHEPVKCNVCKAIVYIPTPKPK